MSEEDSCYSNDQEYFMDLCRGNQFEELKQFIEGMPQNSQFNWGWFNNTGDNFIHMLAGNNLPNIFEYILPVINKRCPSQQVLQILNKQNGSRATPLHYAVIADSKQMIKPLIDAGANPQIVNQQNRTPLQEAQKFEKYQIAEILAPLTKTDIEALKKQVADVNLNDDSSDQEQDPLPVIQQDKQDKTQSKQQQTKQEKIEQNKQQKKTQQKKQTN